MSVMTAPVVLLASDEVDWEALCQDCARVVVRYSCAIKAAAVVVAQDIVRKVSACVGPSSDMFIKLTAFLVPFVLEFFLQRLADYADVEVPEGAPEAVSRQEDRRHAPTASGARPHVSQQDIWEADQQRQRWDTHDRKEVEKEPATVPSWSLDDIDKTSDEDVAAGRHPF